MGSIATLKETCLHIILVADYYLVLMIILFWENSKLKKTNNNDMFYNEYSITMSVHSQYLN